MNRIIVALVCAIVLCALAYAGFMKIYDLSNENATLRQNIQTLTEANQSNINTINKITELSNKIDNLNIALKHMSDTQDTKTNSAITSINKLKSNGGEYEILNTKYPDDPAINCVFKPSSDGCDPDGSVRTETTKVSN